MVIVVVVVVDALILILVVVVVYIVRCPGHEVTVLWVFSVLFFLSPCILYHFIHVVRSDGRIVHTLPCDHCVINMVCSFLPCLIFLYSSV